MRPAIEVTQADREAAAAAYAREHSVPMDCLICSAILAGEEDCQEIVQRFARHRLAERDAVVKWLRDIEKPNGRKCHHWSLASAIEAGEHRK